MGRPSDRCLSETISGRLLKNFLVIVQDDENGQKIFYHEVGFLLEKTVRLKREHVQLRLAGTPSELARRHLDVTVFFDIMHLNRQLFLIFISRNIKFCTAEAVANRRNKTITAIVGNINATYARSGLIVNQAAGDNELASLTTDLSDMAIALSAVARDEHLTEIELHIRTFKEQCSAAFCTLPFKRVPAKAIAKVVYAM